MVQVPHKQVAHPMKPILCITSKHPSDMVLDDMATWAESSGYTLLVIQGNVESAKILSPKRMKRSDYAACINAAKAILKQAR